jgi:hypothetical protein
VDPALHGEIVGTVRLLEYLRGTGERGPQRRHACCPDLGRADECLVAGVIGGHDFEPRCQVRMPSCQPSLAVPGRSSVEHNHPQPREETKEPP